MRGTIVDQKDPAASVRVDLSNGTQVKFNWNSCWRGQHHIVTGQSVEVELLQNNPQRPTVLSVTPLN